MIALRKLFGNHMDAWGITLMIASVALILHQNVTLQNILLLIAVTLGYWFGFAFNDYVDAPYDAQDERKARTNFFVRYHVPRSTLILFFTALLLFLLFVFLQYGERGALILGLSFLIVWAYSAPPLRLKSKPGLDLLTHALFVETYPYFMILYLTRVTWTPLDYVLLSIFFCASLAAQLEQQARDYPVDAKTDTNFTTTFGLNTTLLLLKIVTGVLFINGFVHVLTGVIPIYLLPFGVIGLPMVIRRFLNVPQGLRSPRFVLLSMIAAIGYLACIWGYTLFS